MHKNAFIILNIYPYHFEVIESIYHARYVMCGNINSRDAQDKSIVIMVQNDPYQSYMVDKYGDNIEFIVLDEATMRQPKGIETVINNKIKQLGKDWYIHIINDTYYDEQSLSKLQPNDKKIYISRSVGIYGKYRTNPKDSNMCNIDDDIVVNKKVNKVGNVVNNISRCIKYYYVIHDVPTDDIPNNPGNIICMTPLQQQALVKIEPVCLPCTWLPYTNIDALRVNRTKQFELGYPVFLIQGCVYRRFTALLRKAILQLPHIYPDLPKFKILFLSNRITFIMGLNRLAKYIQVIRTNDFNKYHQEVSACWGIIPLVAPTTQPRYYGPQHLPIQKDTNQSIGAARYSLTSSINYGEAYHQCFIIEENLYSIYGQPHQNILCKDDSVSDSSDNDKTDGNDSELKIRDDACGWPWLRDNSYTYKSNGLNMDEKVKEFLSALKSAIQRYYEEQRLFEQEKNKTSS